MKHISFLRKANVRRLAIMYKNKENELDDEKGVAILDLKSGLKELKNNACLLSGNAYLVIDKKLIANNGIKSKCKCFVKKAIRKIFRTIMGWYYLPIIEQQNQYNETLVKTIKLMNEMYESQITIIEELQKKIDIIEKRG